MKNSLNYFLTLVVFFCCIHSFAQKKTSINIKQISQIEFAQDSVLTFNNFYVQNNALKSIKKSIYPIELRYYVSTVNRNVVDIYILQSNKDSSRVSKLTTMIIQGNVGGFNLIKRLGLRSNLLMKTEVKTTEENLNDIYNLLLNNKFFGHIEEVPRDKTKLLARGYGGNFFELKIGRRFKNFEDPIITNYETQMSETEKNIFNIITYLKKTLKNEKSN